MSFGYVTRDGQRLEARVAADFDRMAAAFKADNGYTLHVRSGARTWDEQNRLYQGWINRIPGFSLAAHPDSPKAYHVESGPSGPRAVDLYDSAPFPGVTQRGTKHDRWMQNNAARFNFENEGYGFSPMEAWHKKWTGSFAGVAGGESNLPPISQDVQNRQIFLNAARGEQLETDGRAGPLTLAAIGRYQQFLKDSGYYRGDVDQDWGPATQAAHELYYAEWSKPAQPSGVPPFPLPAGKWFGPEAGGDNSVSGHHGNREDLRRFQQRLIERGADLGSDGADGLYGPVGSASKDTYTGRAVKALQEAGGLTADSEVGPVTWSAAWTLPVTPTTPTPPVTPPVVPEVPETPSEPGGAYVPTKAENPRGLEVVPATYPGAKYALRAPLGALPRGFKGLDNVPVPVIVDRLIIHWTGVDELQYDWFSYKNSRGSCPTWYILPNGDVVEFIPFEMKTSTTGAEWNWRAVSVEIQKVPGGVGTSAQFEAVAKIEAWLASMDGKSYRGIPVSFKLDGTHAIDHRSVVATECPGDWWHSQLPHLEEAARELLSDLPTEPEIPDPPVVDGKMVLVERSIIAELHEWTGEVLAE